VRIEKGREEAKTHLLDSSRLGGFGFLRKEERREKEEGEVKKRNELAFHSEIPRDETTSKMD